jgi:SWI/SNF-related matrix-associated actin-dependent regulator 1 of chromatin subfamily A
MRAGAPPVAVAARAYARGEVIWSERPLVALQAARSRGSVLACACCLARLGGADGHLAAAARRSGRMEAAAAPPSALPPLPAAPALGAPPARAAVTCARGCGELFCDASCAARADAHGHRLLCVGPLDEDHELYRFKCHALAANEDAYLLAAQARPTRRARHAKRRTCAHAASFSSLQLLARALCAVQDGASEADALAPLDALRRALMPLTRLRSQRSFRFSLGRCGPWWQAAALAEESAAVRAALRSQVEASWALLRAGLLRVLGGPSFSAQAPRCLSLDAYASAITAAALRGGEAVATTPLRAYIDALRLPRRVRTDAPERATALAALEQAAAEAAAARAAEKAALRAGGDDSDSSDSDSESEYRDGDDDDGSASDDEGWGGAALRCADEGAAMRRVLAARRLLCPPLRCAALFVAAAATPHSCAPAAVLSYEDGASYGIDGDDDENEDGGAATAAASAAPLCATLRAARDVAPGEPLSRAWVDPAAPLQERDQALAALSLVRPFALGSYSVFASGFVSNS